MKYSLLTLMVFVTLVCSGLGWLSWEKQIVDRRQECARRLFECGGGIVVSQGADVSKKYKVVKKGNKSRRVSMIRRWLGDQEAEAVLFFDTARIDNATLEMFPEASAWLSQ